MRPDPFPPLLDAAIAVKARAYAPYSGFRVGAALLAEDGSVHSGCNVENAAYPEGTCAEAGAIASMVAAGARRILAIVIVGDGDGPCAPCGGCRQKLSEFADPDLPVLLCGKSGEHRTTTLGALLPEAFLPSSLG